MSLIPSLWKALQPDLTRRPRLLKLLSLFDDDELSPTQRIDHAVLRARFETELREFSILAIYLFICFTALAAFKAAVLRAYDISFAHGCLRR